MRSRLCAAILDRRDTVPAPPFSTAFNNPRMLGNCALGRGLRRREKKATEAGAGRFEKPAPYAWATPPKAHESFIARKPLRKCH